MIFASQDSDLVGAMLRPRAWPNFRFQSEVLFKVLMPIVEWRIEQESGGSNRGVSLIALSVTKEERLQSYVYTGYHLWLLELFFDEAQSVLV